MQRACVLAWSSHMTAICNLRLWEYTFVPSSVVFQITLGEPGRLSSVLMPSLWLSPIDVILFKTSLSCVKLLVGDYNYKVHVELWAIISYLYSYSLRKYGLIYLCSPSFIARKNSLITHRIYNAPPPPPHMRTIRWYRGSTCFVRAMRLTRGWILGRNWDKRLKGAQVWDFRPIFFTPINK